MNINDRVSMLEKLKHDRVFDIETHGDGKLFMFVEKCDEWFTSTLSRDGLLKLIDELRQLAGPDPDEGDGNLKPCPFCGGDPIVLQAEVVDDDRASVSVMCARISCDVRPIVSVDGTDAENCQLLAAKKWNKRAV